MSATTDGAPAALGPAMRLALALDVPSLEPARALIDAVVPHVGVLKVGLELFTAEGPAAVRAVRDAGPACFLDLKLHDIPATVGKAAAAAAALGVRYLTVHAASGPEALEAARRAVEGGPTQLLAVTALTSLDDAALAAIGFAHPPAQLVERLVALATEAGIDGFVCAPSEAAALRRRVPSATLVCPGVRPAGAPRGDQRRVATPTEAIAAGADLLVVGRPIRDAPDPAAAARAIVDEIAAAQP